MLQLLVPVWFRFDNRVDFVILILTTYSQSILTKKILFDNCICLTSIAVKSRRIFYCLASISTDDSPSVFVSRNIWVNRNLVIVKHLCYIHLYKCWMLYKIPKICDGWLAIMSSKHDNEIPRSCQMKLKVKPLDKSTTGISNHMSKTEQQLKLYHAKPYATSTCHPMSFGVTNNLRS